MLLNRKSIMSYLSRGYEVNVRDLQKCHGPHTILNVIVENLIV
jgi:hypothetical protein